MADVTTLPSAARRKVRQPSSVPAPHPAFAAEPPFPEEIVASIRFLACYSENANRHFGYIRDYIEETARTHRGFRDLRRQ